MVGVRRAYNDLNSEDKEGMPNLGVGLGRGRNGLKGEAEEVRTSWRVYMMTS